MFHTLHRVWKCSISMYIKVTAFHMTCGREHLRAVSVVVHSEARLPGEKNCTWWWNAARMENNFMSFSWRLEVLKEIYSVRAVMISSHSSRRTLIFFFLSLFWTETWHIRLFLLVPELFMWANGSKINNISSLKEYHVLNSVCCAMCNNCLNT